MRIVHLLAGDGQAVLSAAGLFDGPPTWAWATKFLETQGHHLLLAVDGQQAVGFITGVETTHPDKGTEMFLYELGVREDWRRRGVGKALVAALAEVAAAQGCYGMWVATEPDNVAALATYRSAGAQPPEAGVTLAWTFDRAEPGVS